jgi:hypothetical protein
MATVVPPPARRIPTPAWTERLLSLRPRQAKGGRTRRRCAASLEHAVDRAGVPRPVFSAAVPVSPEAAGHARDALLDLAERLRGPRGVHPDGLALVRRLLCDGAGPLYYGGPGELRHAAITALQALEADDTPT